MRELCACGHSEPGPAACCREWPIPIEQHEAGRFLEVLEPTAAGPRFAGELQRRPGGECVFLGAKGCSIYDRRPEACRAFAAGACRARRAPPSRELDGAPESPATDPTGPGPTSAS